MIVSKREFSVETSLYTLFAYVRTGYLLHLVTLLEVVILCTLFIKLDIYEWIQKGNGLLKLGLLFPFISFPIFSQLDARSRYQNYKMLRDHFYFYGFHPRIVKPFIKSRCQRDAVIAAAKDLGFAEAC